MSLIPHPSEARLSPDYFFFPSSFFLFEKKAFVELQEESERSGRLNQGEDVTQLSLF